MIFFLSYYTAGTLEPETFCVKLSLKCITCFFLATVKFAYHLVKVVTSNMLHRAAPRKSAGCLPQPWNGSTHADCQQLLSC